MDEFVQQDASDGFVLAPYLTPGGLDDFVDQVVPLLQERGVLRHEYTGTTLREHMGLPPAGRMAAQRAAARSGEPRPSSASTSRATASF